MARGGTSQPVNLRQQQILQMLGELRKANLQGLPKYKPHQSLFGRIMSDVGQTGAQLGQGAVGFGIGMPVQIWHGVRDVVEIPTHAGKGITKAAQLRPGPAQKVTPKQMKGLPTILPRTTADALAQAHIVKQIYEDPEHNIGNALVLGASLGLPAIGKGAEFVRGFREARGAEPGVTVVPAPDMPNYPSGENKLIMPKKGGKKAGIKAVKRVKKTAAAQQVVSTQTGEALKTAFQGQEGPLTPQQAAKIVTGVKTPKGLTIDEEHQAKVARLHREVARTRRQANKLQDSLSSVADAGDKAVIQKKIDKLNLTANNMEEAIGALHAQHQQMLAAQIAQASGKGAPSVSAVHVPPIPMAHYKPEMATVLPVEHPGGDVTHINTYPLRGGARFGLVKTNLASPTHFDLPAYRVAEIYPNGEYKAMGPPMSRPSAHDLLRKTIEEHQTGQPLRAQNAKNDKALFQEFQHKVDEYGNPLPGNKRLRIPRGTEGRDAQQLRQQQGERRAFANQGTPVEKPFDEKTHPAEYTTVVNPKELASKLVKGEIKISPEQAKIWLQKHGGIKPGDIQVEIHGKRTGSMQLEFGHEHLINAVAAGHEEIPIKVRNFSDKMRAGHPRVSTRTRAILASGKHIGPLFGKAADEANLIRPENMPPAPRTFEEIQATHEALVRELAQAEAEGNMEMLVDVHEKLQTLQQELAYSHSGRHLDLEKVAAKIEQEKKEAAAAEKGAKKGKKGKKPKGEAAVAPTGEDGFKPAEGTTGNPFNDAQIKVEHIVTRIRDQEDARTALQQKKGKDVDVTQINKRILNLRKDLEKAQKALKNTKPTRTMAEVQKEIKAVGKEQKPLRVVVGNKTASAEEINRLKALDSRMAQLNTERDAIRRLTEAEGGTNLLSRDQLLAVPADEPPEGTKTYVLVEKGKTPRSVNASKPERAWNYAMKNDIQGVKFTENARLQEQDTGKEVTPEKKGKAEPATEQAPPAEETKPAKAEKPKKEPAEEAPPAAAAETPSPPSPEAPSEQARQEFIGKLWADVQKMGSSPGNKGTKLNDISKIGPEFETLVNDLKKYEPGDAREAVWNHIKDRIASELGVKEEKPPPEEPPAATPAKPEQPKPKPSGEGAQPPKQEPKPAQPGKPTRHTFEHGSYGSDVGQLKYSKNVRYTTADQKAEIYKKALEKHAAGHPRNGAPFEGSPTKIPNELGAPLEEHADGFSIHRGGRDVTDMYRRAYVKKYGEPEGGAPVEPTPTPKPKPPKPEPKAPTEPAAESVSPNRQGQGVTTDNQHTKLLAALKTERESNTGFKMTPDWVKKTLGLKSDDRAQEIFRVYEGDRRFTLSPEAHAALVEKHGETIKQLVASGQIPKSGVRQFIMEKTGLGKDRAQALIDHFSNEHPELRTTRGRPRKNVEQDQPRTGNVAPSSPHNVDDNPIWQIAHDVNGQTQVDAISQPTLEQALEDAKHRGMVNPRKAQFQSGGPAKAPTERTMRINPRALKKLFLTPEQEAKLKPAIKAVWREAQAAGLEGPDPRDLQATFRKALGQKKGDELFNKWAMPTGKGAAPFNEAIAAGLRRAFASPAKEGRGISAGPGEPPTGTHIRIGTRTSYYGGEHEVPIAVGLSDSAFVRTMQYWRYGLFDKENPSRWERAQQAILRATPKAQVAKIEHEMQMAERWREDQHLAKFILTRSQVRALEKEKFFKRKHTGAGDYLDSLQQLALITTLYLKPGYFAPNVAGQIMIMAADHAWNPFSIAKTGLLTRQTYAKFKDVYTGGGKTKNDSDWVKIKSAIRASMGNGMAQSLAGMQKRSGLAGRSYYLARATKEFQNFYGALMDSWQRDNAFYHAAQRAGFGSPDAIRALTLDPEYRGKFYDVTRRANANAVDYSLMWKHDAKFRRTVFFYSWIKGSSKWTARMVTQHPMQTFIGTAQGQELQQKLQQAFQGTPVSYLDGSVVVGYRNDPVLGKIPMIINPASMSVTGSLGDAIKMGTGLLTGQATQSQMPSSMLTPPLSALLAVITGQDPFTGKTFPPGTSAPDIFWQKLTGNIAGFQAYKRFQQAGAKDPLAKMHQLFPYTQSDAFKRMMFGAWKIPVNPKVERSRAISEQAAFLAPPERIKLRTGPVVDEWAANYKKAYGEPIPPDVIDAIKQRLNYEMVKSHWLSGKKHPTPFDTLLADVNYQVVRGDISAAEGKQDLADYAHETPTVQKQIASRMEKGFFPRTEISNVRKSINSYLEDVGLPSLPGLPGA